MGIKLGKGDKIRECVCVCVYEVKKRKGMGIKSGKGDKIRESVCVCVFKRLRKWRYGAKIRERRKDK